MTVKTIRLRTLKCLGTDDAGSNKDEVWMLLQSDCGAPVRFPLKPGDYRSMGTGSDVNTWELKNEAGEYLEVKFETDLALMLFDVGRDFNAGKSDFLGCTSFIATSTAAKTIKNGDDAKYHLDWEWVDGGPS